jgi:hypothetical protein
VQLARSSEPWLAAAREQLSGPWRAPLRGAGAQGVTRGQQVQIHTESLLDFRLQSPVTVTVTVPPSLIRQKGEGEQGDSNDQPQLLHR